MSHNPHEQSLAFLTTQRRVSGFVPESNADTTPHNREESIMAVDARQVVTSHLGKFAEEKAATSELSSTSTSAAATDSYNKKGMKLVVLLGWIGANKKNLGKYATIWESLGYETQMYITPVSLNTISREYYRKHILNGLEDFLFKQRSADETVNELVFHILSNGGLMPFTAMIDVLNEFPQKYSTLMDTNVNIVIDSAPATVDVISDYRAFSHPFVQLLDTTMVKRFSDGSMMHRMAVMFQWLLLLIFAIIFVISDIFARWFLYEPWLTKMIPILVFDPWDANKLFLYSSADSITKVIYVREVIQKCVDRKGGNDNIRVISHDFKESGHVSHLKQFPERYSQLIKQFVNLCQKF